MQDKTFKQAMKETSARIAGEILQEIEDRLDFLEKGQTVAEATADIANPRIREAATEILLATYALVLVDGLRDMGILNQKQAEELRAYLSPRLLPGQSREG